MKRNDARLKLLFYAISFFFFASCNAQKLIAADSIELRTKDKIVSFSVTNASYVLIKDRSYIRVMKYDTAFHRQFIATQELDKVLNSNILLGAAKTGNVVTILFSSKLHKHFSTLVFD